MKKPTTRAPLSFESEFLQKCGFPVRLHIELSSFGQDETARNNFMSLGQKLILSAIAQLCQNTYVKEKLSQKIKTIYVRNVSLNSKNRIGLGGGSLDINGIWCEMSRLFSIDDLVHSVQDQLHVSRDLSSQMKDPVYRERILEEKIKREGLLGQMGLLYNDLDKAKAAGDSTNVAELEKKIEDLQRELSQL